MKSMEQKNESESIHQLLSYSYSIYFIGVILGILFDLFYPIRIIPTNIQLLGWVFIFIGPLLIFWAQKSSRSLRNIDTPLSKDHFKRGPYAFSRRPTHFGLFLMVLGFALLSNSIVLIGTTLISYSFSSIFIKRQENILTKRYGEEYLKYKEEVNAWF